MSVSLANRLAHVAKHSTLQLTHYGRRSATPYEVTIWFMVEGETVYLVTANRERQWSRNVSVRPEVQLRIGDETFTGRVDVLTETAAIDHAVDLMAAKYWYTRPYVWLARQLGWQASSAAFRVRVDSEDSTTPS